jgi:hypothetical protein
MNCKLGDLAIVVNAQYRCNIGNIVRIVAPHDGTGDIVFTDQGQVWFAECARPMKWDVYGRVYRRMRGPVPDNRLQPIRSSGIDDDIVAMIQRLLKESKGSHLHREICRERELAELIAG